MCSSSFFDNIGNDETIPICNAKINPIIWARLGTGYHFEDLRPNRFLEVAKLIIQYYIPNNVLTRNTYFYQDRTSIKFFIDKLLNTMSDNASLVAIDEKNNNICAVLLLKIVNKLDFGRVFSRPSVKEGSEYDKCKAIKMELNKRVDIFLQYKCDIFMRYYLLCVTDEYRGQKLGYYLLRYGLEVARSLRIPAACGIFENLGLQIQAKRLGFTTLEEINYKDWIEDGEVVFDDVDTFNKSCLLMAIEVPPAILTEIVEPVPPVSDKKGKKDKKNKKKKK